MHRLTQHQQLWLAKFLFAVMATLTATAAQAAEDLSSIVHVNVVGTWNVTLQLDASNLPQHQFWQINPFERVNGIGQSTPSLLGNWQSFGLYTTQIQMTAFVNDPNWGAVRRVWVATVETGEEMEEFNGRYNQLTYDLHGELLEHEPGFIEGQKVILDPYTKKAPLLPIMQSK